MKVFVRPATGGKWTELKDPIMSDISVEQPESHWQPKVTDTVTATFTIKKTPSRNEYAHFKRLMYGRLPRKLKKRLKKAFGIKGKLSMEKLLICKSLAEKGGVL